MRAAFIAMLILLLPAALLASPTMGVYFTFVPGQMYFSPTEGQPFDAYVYGHDIQCFLTASEFEVSLPPGIMEGTFTLPPGALNIGDPATGIAISYWPPMNGWDPGYNLLCTIHLFAYEGCVPTDPDGMSNAYVHIVPNPSSGLIAGSCFPDNQLFNYIGLTSIICPAPIAVQTKTWGSIKSLF